jgi:hypothetical protein
MDARRIHCGSVGIILHGSVGSASSAYSFGIIMHMDMSMNIIIAILTIMIIMACIIATNSITNFIPNFITIIIAPPYMHHPTIIVAPLTPT